MIFLLGLAVGGFVGALTFNLLVVGPLQRRVGDLRSERVDLKDTIASLKEERDSFKTEADHYHGLTVNLDFSIARAKAALEG
jgi:hypothetical protein